MESREIAWTLGALEDSRVFLDFIAGDDPSGARRWQAEVAARIERVAEFPYSGRQVPEFGRDDLHEVIYGNCRIVYQASAEHVVIVRVREAHHLMPDSEFSVRTGDFPNCMAHAYPWGNTTPAAPGRGRGGGGLRQRVGSPRWTPLSASAPFGLAGEIYR